MGVVSTAITAFRITCNADWLPETMAERALWRGAEQQALLLLDARGLSIEAPQFSFGALPSRRGLLSS